MSFNEETFLQNMFNPEYRKMLRAELTEQLRQLDLLEAKLKEEMDNLTKDIVLASEKS